MKDGTHHLILGAEPFIIISRTSLGPLKKSGKRKCKICFYFIPETTHMKQALTLLLAALFLQAGAQKRGFKLQLGNTVTYTKGGDAVVSGTTNLTPRDTLSLILSNSKPFDSPSILFGVFKLTNGQKQHLSFDAIQLKPGTKVVRNRFAATDLIRRYGYGNFLLQFTHGKNVLATGLFSIQTK